MLLTEIAAPIAIQTLRGHGTVVIQYCVRSYGDCVGVELDHDVIKVLTTVIRIRTTNSHSREPRVPNRHELPPTHTVAPMSWPLFTATLILDWECSVYQAVLQENR